MNEVGPMPADNLAAAGHSPTAVTAIAHPFSSLNRRATLLVCVLTLFALGLRLYRLSNQSLWEDEVYSVFTAMVPLDQVWHYSTKVNYSLPTYFLLLKPFLPERGIGVESPARLLSAIAGALSVPVFIGLVYCWRRQTRTALLAGLLLAVNPLHIWYSQEARAYALMLFFGLLMMLFLELALFSGRSEWLTLYLFCALPALALHKCALVFPALCLLWHGQYLWRQDKPVVQKLKELLIHLPVWIGVLLLMFTKMTPPGEGYRRGGSILQFGYTFLTFLGGYSFGPSLNEIQSSSPWAAAAANWFQLLLLLAVLALIVLVCKLNWRKLLFARETALLVAGIGIVAAYSTVSGFNYNIRYVLPSLFGFLALVAALSGTEAERPRWARFIIVSMLVIGLWADAQWFYNPRYRKPDARALAKWLVDNKHRLKSWTLLPSYLKLPLAWYLAVLDPDVLKHAMTPSAVRTTSFPPVPDVLILHRRNQLDKPDQLINSYRLAAGTIQTNRSFAGFEVYIREPPSGAN